MQVDPSMEQPELDKELTDLFELLSFELWWATEKRAKKQGANFKSGEWIERSLEKS